MKVHILRTLNSDSRQDNDLMTSGSVRFDDEDVFMTMGLCRTAFRWCYHSNLRLEVPHLDQ